MTAPSAYCFFQDIEPRSPLEAVFERDYLLYVVRGAVRLNTGQKSWLLPPSFAAWIPAGTPLSVEINKPVTSCSVLAEPGFCTSFPNKACVFQMSPLTRHMIGHCKDWGPDDPQPQDAAGFMLALLNTCAKLVAKSVDVKRPYATDPALRKIITVTQERLDETITASEMARVANLSERTMQRRFEQELGLTWSQILTRLRMIRAVELLAENDLSVIQIAAACGFGSLSAFNRAFRAFADTTPSQFRKNLAD